MPKIEESANGNILIDNVPYSRGNLVLDVNSDFTRIGIYHVRFQKNIVKMQPLGQFTDNNDATFADYQDFIDYLDPFFFRRLSGGGGSGTGWQGEVNTFADLPAAADNTGAVYLVKTKTGSQLTFNLKRSGFYQSDGVSWTKLSQVQFMFTDDELTFKDDVDNTKQLGFQLNLISTSTRRTVTFPDTDITLDDQNDPRPPLAHASTHEESGSDEIESTNLKATFSPNNYTPTSSDLAGQLDGIDNALGVSGGIPEAPNDGQIYFRKGDTADWIRKSGLVEAFDLASKEGNQNANSGIFQGVFSLAPEGTYNTMTTIFSQLTLSPAQSFRLRAALYELDGTLITQGDKLLDNTTTEAVQTITLDTEVVFTAPRAVYCVIGVNENLGGGSVQIFRMNANQTNDSEIAFQFNVPNGDLPNNLPAVGNTNNVRYQIYYAS